MNMEKINAARAELTEQAQKEKRTELANFIEEHINSMLTTEDAADKVKGKTLNDCISKVVAEAKADAHAEAEEEINKAREQVNHLTAEVERLEAQNQKLSNPTLTEFKVLADQLQDVYHKITNLIDQQDEELAQKMSQALNKLTEGWGL